MRYHLHIPHHVPGKGDEFSLISFFVSPYILSFRKLLYYNKKMTMQI